MGFTLVFAACSLFACDGGSTREREALPFLRIKLKNVSPPGGRQATATAVGKMAGAPGQTHTVDPVPPGAEQESQPPGTVASDEVAITVTFDGGPEFRGNASYPGSHISTIDIECAEPEGGMARVQFATGRPAEEIPLRP